MDEKNARKALVEVCQLAYQRRYICGTEGNFSVRLADDVVLTTPKGACKGRVQPEDLVLTNINGELLPNSLNGNPSTELAMHLTAYNIRPDIKAVVHAHPTCAVGFTVAGVALDQAVLPEVICTLGSIPTASYATPSTKEVSDSIEKYVKEYDVMMMDHHGALCLGSDIWDAFYKLETLEHYAETMLVAHLLGGVKPLSSEQVRKLIAVRGVYGLARPLPQEFVARSTN